MAVNRRANRRRPETFRSWKTPRPAPPPPPSPSTSPAPRRPRRRRPLDPGAPTIGLDAAIDDFTRSWERGEGPKAEGYVDRLPAGDQAELVYHEYCLAEADGLGPDPGDYLRRFPGQAGPLGRLFSLHGAFSDSGLRDLVERGPAALPEAGDEIGPYRLIRELGRGAFARVFLAEQGDLGERPVVVKVSTRASSEPTLLARARHAHIVEVLRKAEADSEGGTLHLVCMPFLGGATLSAVLEGRRALGRPARSGRDLLADLDRAAAPEYPRLDPGPLASPGSPDPELARPAREVIAGLSHARSLAWVVARLAEALDHAHRRGVTHGDLKPSNILLTADASPMLFDFNLAVDRREAADAGLAAADPGGTLAYMAPERLRAIADPRPGPPGRAGKPHDPHRADLYALGLVLLEALTGRRPSLPRRDLGDARALASALLHDRARPPEALVGPSGRSIPPALRSILARCLAADPLDRYARGAELAEDLDRWRCDRRLAFAEETPLAGLARRARRHRPALLGVALTLATALVGALAANALIAGTRRDQALSKLTPVYDRADSGAFDYRLAGHWRLDENHDPAELSARQLARYDAGVAPDWPDRDDVRSLPDRERGELEAWLCEQALRHATALGRRPESPVDWRRAVALLDRTIARFPLASLKAERLNLIDRLGLAPAAPTAPARGPRWMDDYLAGVAAEPLHAREALEHYSDALRDRPDFFWGHYRAAVAACRIDEYPLAVEHLRQCLRRRPANAALHALLASALNYVEAGTPAGSRGNLAAEALAESDHAVALDADLALAYRTRAQIRHASGRVAEVDSDVGRFAILGGGSSRGRDRALRLALRFRPGPNYAERSAEIEDHARRALADDPGDHESGTTLAAKLALDARVGDALAIYDRILEAEPDHLRAHYQRALELRRGQPDRGNQEFARLIEQPRFEELLSDLPVAIRAFHYVATDLMTRGNLPEALRVADRGLVHALRSSSLRPETLAIQAQAPGAIKLAPRGESYYLLARIHAEAARTEPDRIYRAIECLDRAFACNDDFRTSWFPRDRLFDHLRGEILARVKVPTVDH